MHKLYKQRPQQLKRQNWKKDPQCRRCPDALQNTFNPTRHSDPRKTTSELSLDLQLQQHASRFISNAHCKLHIPTPTCLQKKGNFQSDLTPRDTGINGGYSHLANFASRNLAKPQPVDSLTVKAVDQSIIKSIASKNMGGNSMGSKPSS